MTEGRGRIDPDVFQRRLPDGWTVTEDAGSVYGRTETTDPDGAAPDVAPTPGFAIRPVKGYLWRASWCPPASAGRGAAPATERVTGIRERCVEWVVEKAGGE